ncbi:MAG: hypothetical protein ACFFD4_15725 [Candidatus Odinarchaeota archaeon]
MNQGVNKFLEFEATLDHEMVLVKPCYQPVKVKPVFYKKKVFYRHLIIRTVFLSPTSPAGSNSWSQPCLGGTAWKYWLFWFFF